MLVLTSKLEKIVELVDRFNQWGYSSLELITMPKNFSGVVNPDEVKIKNVDGYLTLNQLKYKSKFRLHYITDVVDENEIYDFGIMPILEPKMTLEKFSEKYPDLIFYLQENKEEFSFMMRNLIGVVNEQSELLRASEIKSDKMVGNESADQSSNQGESGE